MFTSRTAPSARSARARRVSLAVAVAFLAAGCSAAVPTAPVAPGSAAQAETDERPPIPDPYASNPPSTMTVFLVGQSPTDFYLERALIDLGETPVDLIDRVRLSISGLLFTVGAFDPVALPGLATFVPAGTALNGVSESGGIVTIDVGGAFGLSSGGAEEERMLAQQLAHTALVDPALTSIRLLIDGAPITELWGHLDWSVPLGADPRALAPVVISDPGPATRMCCLSAGAGSQVTIIGETAVFEGAVEVRLEDAAGSVIVEGSVIAHGGGPDRGRWTWDVTVPGTGTWTVIAEVPTLARDGSTVRYAARRVFALD